MPTETPLQRLASLQLGQPVIPWIKARRPAKSWRKISIELREETDGEIDLPPQTLLNWARSEPVPDAASASAVP